MVQHFTMFRKFSQIFTMFHYVSHCGTRIVPDISVPYRTILHNFRSEVLRCTVHVPYGTAWYHAVKNLEYYIILQ